ncbi:MAG: hypothetical protein RIB32_02490 [Phycisphaerales bacterium]
MRLTQRLLTVAAVIGLMWLVNLLIGAVVWTLILSESPARFPANLVDGLGEPSFYGMSLSLATAIAFFQAVYLIPVRRPVIDSTRVKGHSRSVQVSLAIAGLGAALLTGTGVAAIFGVAEAFEPIVGDLRAWRLTALALIVLAPTWCVFSILIILFTRRGPRERVLSRVASSLFLGTVLEVLAIIPLDVMIRRRSDCYCATGTFIALIWSAPVGLFALGPLIVLPLLRRRRKRYYLQRCDACQADMRGCLDADRCPSCGAGWSGRETLGPMISCAGCGRGMAGSLSAGACPDCGHGFGVDPLLRSIMRCHGCGYDLLAAGGSRRCPECGEPWGTVRESASVDEVDSG